MSGDVRTVPTPRAWLWAEGADPERALLSAHFTYREAVARGVEAAPEAELADDLNAIAIRAAILASAVLEPWRELLGCPLRVTSWTRTRKKNAGLPGGAKNSDHLYGCGVDVVPVGAAMPRAFALLHDQAKPSGRGGLPVDQAILYGDHIHVSHDPLASTPARKFYVAERRGDDVVYRAYIPTVFYAPEDAATCGGACKP